MSIDDIKISVEEAIGKLPLYLPRAAVDMVLSDLPREQSHVTGAFLPLVLQIVYYDGIFHIFS